MPLFQENEKLFNTVYLDLHFMVPIFAKFTLITIQLPETRCIFLSWNCIFYQVKGNADENTKNNLTSVTYNFKKSHTGWTARVRPRVSKGGDFLHSFVFKLVLGSIQPPIK